MNDELKIICEVSAQAEAVYERAKELGDHAAYVLKGENENRRSQMTGLENIAESALKTSDIFDYIKRQTARSDPWRKGWPGEPGRQPTQQRFPGQTEPSEMFGTRLLKYLEEGLSTRCTPIYRSLGIDDKKRENEQERRRIYILLIRQFIRQMVVEYEYQISGVERDNNGAQS